MFLEARGEHHQRPCSSRLPDPVLWSLSVTSHRVNPPPAHTARYSIPTFWSCDLDVPLTPIKSCVSEERPQKYEVITAGAYGKSIMDAIYMVGPGVQA